MLSYNDSTIIQFQAYDRSHTAGVVAIGTAGILTLLSILYFVFAGRLNHTKSYSKTHIHGHFLALLVANSLQGIGSVMNFEWIHNGGVQTGPVCSAQAGIKQAGNVGTAFISLTISVHLFTLLFLRTSFHQRFFYSVLGVVGVLVLGVVLIGPLAIQEPEHGPYFGISGSWCWITASYPRARVCGEYLLEFMSAGLCIVIYLLLLLRVRGNLKRTEEGKWRLRHSQEKWQMTLGRDILDASMFKVVKSMIWFPVVYTLVIVPIAFARLSEFAGQAVPFEVTVFTSVLFNLTGFFNVILLLWTSKRFPDAETIPHFSTPRQHLRDSMAKTGGLVPFTLDKSETAEEFKVIRQQRTHLARTNSEISSVTQTLIVPPGFNRDLGPSSFSPLSLPPSAASSRRSSMESVSRLVR